MMRAASSVIPARRGSTVPNIKLALKPPETPANAAAKPAMGCRPTDRKMMAPIGTSST